MNILPIQSTVDDTSVPIEDLAGNKHLTEKQKIHQASQQFEAIMLRQILSEMQKPITSESSGDSTSAGIYQDYISTALAQSISKSHGFGFAKVFEQQLSPQIPAHHQATPAGQPEHKHSKKVGTFSAKVHE